MTADGTKCPIWRVLVPSAEGGALSLTFDNLGEAAELEMGALRRRCAAGRPLHRDRVVPALLDRLAERELAATFFVEGLNAELYPELLQTIDASGPRGRLPRLAPRAMGRDEHRRSRPRIWRAALPPSSGSGSRSPVCVRPAVGSARAGWMSCARRACVTAPPPVAGRARTATSPCCRSSGATSTPAACCRRLPAAREQMTGSSDPVEPADFVASLEAAIAGLATAGGFMAVVLHPFMLDWLGDENLAALLDRVAAAGEDGIWVARCDEAAEHVLAHPDRFADGTSLDATSWA